MNPQLVKLLSLVAAVVVYMGAGFITDPAIASMARELAAALFGSQAIRRAGDLEPIKGGL